jgi:hypothetical protein
LLKSHVTEQEILLVLARPHIAAVTVLSFRNDLAKLLARAELVTITERIAACRDPHDDKFLELAVNGRADLIYVQHGRGRPSAGETPANTVDVFLASAAPLERDSGCPPNRVNPTREALAASDTRNSEIANCGHDPARSYPRGSIFAVPNPGHYREHWKRR